MYLPEKFELNYTTPTTGQNMVFTVLNGRLYMNCDNPAETFGYNKINR